MYKSPAYDSGGIVLSGCMLFSAGLALLASIIMQTSVVTGILLTSAGLFIGLGLGLFVMGLMVFRSTRERK